VTWLNDLTGEIWCEGEGGKKGESKEMLAARSKATAANVDKLSEYPNAKVKDNPRNGQTQPTNAQEHLKE